MNQRLDEISFLRPIIICILVLMHAFTMYAGNWDLPEGIEPIRAYFWIQKISFSCMLEIFVFISGYIFGYQLILQKQDYSFKKLVSGKFKRLILPSMLFSLLYILCFTNFALEHQWSKIAYNTIAGYAHLWFLPMLFWCFIGSWIIVKLKLNDFIILPLLLILSIFSYLPLPFQLNCMCYYLFFFHLGLCSIKHREKIKKIAVYLNSWGVLILFAAYIIYVMLHTLNIGIIHENIANNTIDRILRSAQINACKISYAFCGVILLYGIALRYVSNHSLSNFTTDLNKYCFGIYIFQQFILEFVYYHLPLPQFLGSYWLPWMGCIITLISSYILARCFLLTKSGKYLLG